MYWKKKSVTDKSVENIVRIAFRYHYSLQILKICPGRACLFGVAFNPSKTPYTRCISSEIADYDFVEKMFLRNR